MWMGDLLVLPNAVPRPVIAPACVLQAGTFSAVPRSVNVPACVLQAGTLSAVPWQAQCLASRWICTLEERTFASRIMIMS